MRPDKPESVGLPVVTFLYTLDQLAAMLGVEQKQLGLRYIYYNLRSTGKHLPHMMRAVNIAPPTSKEADWRVSQGEFVRWCRAMGIRVRTQGKVT